MRKLIGIGLLLPTLAWGLTNEQMADRYLLDAQAAYKSGNYKSAVSAFTQIEQLKVTMVDDFHFFYAMALHNSGNPEKAWEQVSLYLEKTQRNGTYYQKALQLYGDLEPVVSKGAKDSLGALKNQQSIWSKLSSDIGVRNTQVQELVAQQVATTETLLAGKQYANAQQQASAATSRLKGYTSTLEQYKSKFTQVNNDAYVIQEAQKQGLISQQLAEPHLAFFRNLKRDLQNLDFESFDQRYQQNQNQLSADASKTRQQMQQIKDQHGAEIRQLADLAQCHELATQLKAYEKLTSEKGYRYSSLRERFTKDCRGYSL